MQQFNDHQFVEIWQGKVTVVIDGHTFQFNKNAWESYKSLRSGPYPQSHEEVAWLFDSDEIKEIKEK